MSISKNESCNLSFPITTMSRLCISGTSLLFFVVVRGKECDQNRLSNEHLCPPRSLHDNRAKTQATRCQFYPNHRPTQWKAHGLRSEKKKSDRTTRPLHDKFCRKRNAFRTWNLSLQRGLQSIAVFPFQSIVHARPCLLGEKDEAENEGVRLFCQTTHTLNRRVCFST